MFHLKSFSLFLLIGLVFSLASGVAGSAKYAIGQTVRFETNVGDIDVLLHPNDAPIAVANFLSYANAPAGSNYDGTFFHRSINNFVLQGGGIYVPQDRVLGNSISVPAQPPIVNEFGRSNIRGTIAFAKLGGDPDSATNQWFFNTDDNGGVPPLGLDFQNGGFTVFGSVVSGMNVVDQIQDSSIFNFGMDPFTNLPLLNIGADFTPVNDIADFFIVNSEAEFVVVNSVTVVPVLLGDVNLDGAVNFADIPSFITLLTSGGYQNEGDVDQSATVDFADIPAFIAVLIGQ